MKNNKLESMNVLYVEDDIDTQKATSLILEDYISELYVAKNGVEALEIFNTNAIDLVITDILMPKMNGLELAKSIRNWRVNPNCPIIITTAHTEVNYLLESIKLKVDGYVLKPIDVNILLETMQKVLLPLIQFKELNSKNLLIKSISTFVGGKKTEIINFLLEKRDEDNMFYGSYEDIINELHVSKPTVAKTFQKLIEVGLVVKIRNKVYQLNI